MDHKLSNVRYKHCIYSQLQEQERSRNTRKGLRRTKKVKNAFLVTNYGHKLCLGSCYILENKPTDIYSRYMLYF